MCVNTPSPISLLSDVNSEGTLHSHVKRWADQESWMRRGKSLHIWPMDFLGGKVS